MKHLRFYLFLLLMTSGTVYGQTENKFSIDIFSSDQRTVFENTLRLLLNSDYFVQSVNKEAGFIQCKALVPDNRWLSKKDGSIIEYNLLIRTVEKGVRIDFQANLTEKIRMGSVGNVVNFVDDQGVTRDARYYNELMRYLRLNL